VPTESLTSTRTTGAEPWASLPPALATPPGAGAICDGDGARPIKRGAAEAAFTTAPVMVAHASLTARRPGLSPPPRPAEMPDVLEPFALGRPARVLVVPALVQGDPAPAEHVNASDLIPGQPFAERSCFR